MALALFQKKGFSIYKFCSNLFRNPVCSKTQALGNLQNHNLQAIRSCSRHIVQMRGLDFDTSEKDVIDFFRPLGITPKEVHLKCDGAGRTASVSEVEFSSHAEAVVAMRKRNAFLGNRFIRLTLKSEVNEPVKKQDDISSPANRASLNVEGKAKVSHIPDGHVLRMKNAPWRLTDEAIYNFFWPVGAYPISVKPLYDDNDLRTGEFDVQFQSQEDVQHALSKNNSYLGNKFVELSFKPS